MALQGSQNQSILGMAEQLTPWLRAADSTQENDVYVGNVVLPGQQQRRTAYVKIFPPRHRKGLVFNEVVAHQLAQQCALPSPFTFPCACRVSMLRRGTRGKMVPSDSEYVLGVASLEETPRRIQQSGGDFAAKWADLMNWPLIANVAVFDELLGNDDRHIANLIRRGPQDYVLIDNERILFGEPWFDQDLTRFATRRCDANVIADTIAEGTDELMRQRMIAIAQRFVMQIQLIPEASFEQLEAICEAPQGITAELIAMLNERRRHLQYLMQWHLQKGDLFKASSNQ